MLLPFYHAVVDFVFVVVVVDCCRFDVDVVMIASFML